MIRKILKSNRIRLILTCLGIVGILIYRVLKLIPGGERWTYTHLVHPYHVFMAGLCDHTRASVAEILIIAAIAGVIAYTVGTVVYIICKKQVLMPVISYVITLIMLFCVIYGGFCILWGVYYGAPDVEEICGISSDGVEHEDLIKVDRYFAELANEYSSKVERDRDGHFLLDEEKVFDHGLSLYDNVSDMYPGLKAEGHRAKPFRFSRIMSLMNFSGFFFPLTGEANINVDEPGALVPVCIAHEYAHQRGIAAEDECNFIGILACLEDGDDTYVYSASLSAMIYLQNALYKSGDKDTWQEIRDTYSDGVVQDISDNSRYWSAYRKTVTYKATENTYDAFLKSYDQKLGRETYGECVNLLVEYFR